MARPSKSLSLLDRPTAWPLTNTQLPEWPSTLSTWRTPFLDMEASSLSRRYLPRPIGQRMRHELAAPTNSLTRPLILDTESLTLMSEPEKTAFRVAEGGARPSAFLATTLDMAAMLESRSPREERFLPLPVPMYLLILALAVTA